MVARKKRPPLVGNCSDGAWTAPASGGCAPPGLATRWSPLRGDCAALRSPRAHGRTRCAACGRCAQTCGRESEGWARWRAPRPRPCAARHRVLCRPQRGAAAARRQWLCPGRQSPRCSEIRDRVRVRQAVNDRTRGALSSAKRSFGTLSGEGSQTTPRDPRRFHGPAARAAKGTFGPIQQSVDLPRLPNV